MRYLKTYENTNPNNYWVTYERLYDYKSFDSNIFDDRESAENYYIELINDLEKSKYWYKNYEELKPNNYITTIEDAYKWIDNNNDIYRVNIQKANYKGKYELPEEIKVAKNTKKYNL